jgi:hypothetical protein
MLLLLLLLRMIVMMAPTARIIHFNIFILIYYILLVQVLGWLRAAFGVKPTLAGDVLGARAQGLWRLVRALSLGIFVVILILQA